MKTFLIAWMVRFCKGKQFWHSQHLSFMAAFDAKFQNGTGACVTKQHKTQTAKDWDERLMVARGGRGISCLYNNVPSLSSTLGQVIWNGSSMTSNELKPSLRRSQTWVISAPPGFARRSILNDPPYSTPPAVVPIYYFRRGGGGRRQQ